jgi:hypothetical protein
MHFHDEHEHDHIPFRFEGAPGHGQQIVVTSAKRQWLAEHWERQWRRPPTDDELERLVEDFVREEVLYRGALQLGLDRSDLVVRRRLVQKMEALALEGTPTLGEAEVIEYFLDHREQYWLPETVSFSHLFFGLATRGSRAHGDALAALEELRRSGATEAVGIGDVPTMPDQMNARARPEVASAFGHEFADAVFGLDLGTWGGPIASPFGYHLVLVAAHTPARLPELADVASRVAADLDNDRRTGAIDGLYAELRPRYEIVIEDDMEHDDATHGLNLPADAEEAPA